MEMIELRSLVIPYPGNDRLGECMNDNSTF